MSETAIQVENLAKQYRIGGRREKYRTLRDTLADTVASVFRRNRDTQADGEGSFWALDGVSFEVRRGEVVGVIGRNGAGKSTLLKILSRVTEPTSGFAEIHGRIGALLEVGTGFHPELTGRENVFLNGAILGMRREEVERNFDQIVEFAEVTRFIDTPVKRYSSGMHLRLAFSVAAHLEPEILLVDEVLAVGDVAFQKKCMGKMENVAAEGRTVLFVSHNLAAVKELCETSIVLDGGKLVCRGSVVEGLARYSQIINAADPPDAPSARGTHWRQLRINGRLGGMSEPAANDRELTLDAVLDLRGTITRGQFYCIVDDSTGSPIVHQRIEINEVGYDRLEPGCYDIRVAFPALWLAPGLYTIFFKFIAYRTDGAQERQLSERVLLDITGSATGIGRATLAPPMQWSVRGSLEKS
jgi:lipopolysaccharide transport system ATP-binding protein